MVLELGHRVVFQRFHHVVDERLGRHIANARARIALQHQMSGGLHQVGLAEADAAEDEKRIGAVAAARVFADLQRGGARQLVGVAFHMLVKGVIGVHGVAGVGARRAIGGAAVGAKSRAAIGFFGAISHISGAASIPVGRFQRARRFVPADFHLHQSDAGVHRAQRFLNHAGEICFHIIQHIAVRRQEF